MKARLATATSFMILGMIATVVSLVLFFPFFHWILFIIGVIVSFASSEWGVGGMGDGRGLKGGYNDSDCRIVMLHNVSSEPTLFKSL